MLQFSSVDDLRRHYCAVSERIRGPRGALVVNATATKVSAVQNDHSQDDTKVPIGYKKYRISFRDVVEVVLAETGLSECQLWSRRRPAYLCEARHLTWALARDLCHHLSLTSIGRMSEDRDHTTIINGAPKGCILEPFERLKKQLEDLRDSRLGAPIYAEEDPADA